MTVAHHDLAVEHETFDSLDPATGAVVATFPVHTAREVEATVVRARAAAAWWRSIGFAERRKRLLAVRAAIARRAEEVAELIHREMGKPVFDGYLEVLMACEHLSFAAKQAKRVLGPRRVRPGVLTPNHAATVEYRPLGVVGLITPWNYPLLIPMSDAAAALGAGNAVVCKPSEFTPAVARWFVDRFAEAIPEHRVVELVTGFGDTGAALCTSGVDKLSFTGSQAVGRKIMASCAETLTPVTLELGGKDAMIVDHDADLDAAADAAAFGAYWNAGQTCLSVERAYVHEQVFDAFVAKVADRIRDVRAGAGPDTKLGPMATPGQLETVAEQIRDALERGATAVVGGLESIRPPYIDPVLLTDVPDDALMMTAETFGPTLPVFKVRDAEEGVARANVSPFALGASVFSKRRGRELARGLRSGACSINGVMSFYAHAGLPFGGVGDSGFGTVHGPDGLRNFTHPKAITQRRFGLGKLAPDQLERHPRAVDYLPKVARLLYGRG